MSYSSATGFMGSEKHGDVTFRSENILFPDNCYCRVLLFHVSFIVLTIGLFIRQISQSLAESTRTAKTGEENVT